MSSRSWAASTSCSERWTANAQPTEDSPVLGEGIIKGLAETARNFFGSYVSKERLTTVQYPEQRLPQIEATRNFPFLVFDGTDPEAGLRCVSCQICEKECPPKC